MSDQHNDGPDTPDPGAGAVHRPRVPVEEDHEPAAVDEEISEQLSVDPERDGEKG